MMEEAAKRREQSWKAYKHIRGEQEIERAKGDEEKEEKEGKNSISFWDH
jgi:hypothetical protein